MKVSMLILNTNPIIHDARVRKEALALASAGHSVTLVALARKNESVPKSFGPVGLKVLPLLLRNVHWRVLLPLQYAEFVVSAMVLLIAQRADVYHAHDLCALPSAWLAAKLTRARVIYDSHELFTERPIRFTWIWRKVERFLLNRVDVIVAASEERADVMHKEYGARQRPQVIMNCPEAVTTSSEGGLRASLSEADRNKKIVVYQGGLAPGRCLEELIAASCEFEKNAVLVFLGSRSAYADQVLKPLVKRLSVTDRVIFLPAVPSSDVASYIASADVGVVIYRNSCRNNYLCAPNKLYDYCMAGLAVAGCDFPPVRAVIEQYRVGVMFTPEDPASITKEINNLLSDEVELAAAKRRTHDVAIVYNWESQAGKLQQLYKALAYRNGAGRLSWTDVRG
jgi:glycosyltransferase involved in cell wall biosynthesis